MSKNTSIMSVLSNSNLIIYKSERFVLTKTYILFSNFLLMRNINLIE